MENSIVTMIKEESSSNVMIIDQVLPEFDKIIKIEDTLYKGEKYKSFKCDSAVQKSPIQNSVEYNTEIKRLSAELDVSSFNLNYGIKIKGKTYKIDTTEEKTNFTTDVNLLHDGFDENLQIGNKSDNVIDKVKEVNCNSPFTNKADSVTKVYPFDINHLSSFNKDNISLDCSSDISNKVASDKFDISMQSLSRKILTWPPSQWEDGPRRSAFHPYKPATVLTNLQRGNIQAKTQQLDVTQFTWHMKAGRGDLRLEDIINVLDINEKDDYGITALMWSSAYGQTTTVQRLLERGSDPMICGGNQQTALHMAAYGGHHEVIKLLLAYRANVDATDSDGNTPIMYAVYEDHPHAVHELLLGGANLCLLNFSNTMPYKLAVENNCVQAKAVIENHLISILSNKNI